MVGGEIRIVSRCVIGGIGLTGTNEETRVGVGRFGSGVRRKLERAIGRVVPKSVAMKTSNGNKK